MKKKSKPKMEFRYYQVPPGSPILALLGQKWVQNYGNDVDYLHFHNYMEVGFCYEGVGDLVLGDDSFTFSDRTFSVIPQNFPHTTNSVIGTLSRWEYIFIDVDSFISEIYKTNSSIKNLLLTRLNKKALYLTEADHPHMAAMIIKMLNLVREEKEFYLEEIKGILLAFLFETAKLNREDDGLQADPKSSNLISSALDYISDYYGENIKIEKLAQICHISETHFRRIFSSCMGMTPNEYINYVRIRSACEYLGRSDDTIASISHKVGYDTLSTFNRNFLKVVGESPKKWMANRENYKIKLLNYHIHTEEGW